MALIYPAGDEQQTLNLGLSTWGMDEVLAQNMILIDTAVGSGSSVQINGAVIPNVNFVNSATVTFSVVGSNVSATATSSGGTVTSFSAGNIDTIATTSVATATTTPALTFALATQSANTVWAGPTTGAAATPTFRALVAEDIPSLSTVYLPLAGGTMTGVITLEAAGPGLKDSAGSAGISGNVLTVNGSGNPVWTTPATSGTVTSVSFTGGLISVATATTTPALTVAGTSGGIVYFSSASTWASSAALPAGDFVLGGGAGAAPTATFSIVPIANGGTGTGSTLVGLVRGSALAFTAAEISGDATTSGSNALTLATVNSNVGSFTYASITVNAKGLITAAASGAAPTGTVTTVGFTGGLISVATATTTPALTVAGTSGGIPYFSSASTWASSALLASTSVVLGGGAGAAPNTSAQLVFVAPTLTVGLAGTSSGILSLTGSTSGNATFTAPAVAGTRSNQISTSNDLNVNGITVGLGLGHLISNVAVGYQALYSNTSGISNTALGYSALYSNTSGNANTALGYSALVSNQTGNGNSAIGDDALYTAVAANNNMAMGGSALYNNTGGNNVGIGTQALFSNSSGGNNVAIGYQAGYTAVPGNANVTGGNNTWLGFQAGPGTSSQLNNSTALGNMALNTASNQIVLGNSSVTATLLGGGSFTAPTTVTGQTGIVAGLAGTASGVLTLAGSTSGAATITAPAVAGTVTNPIAFSNSINLSGAATVYQAQGNLGITATAIIAATVTTVGGIVTALSATSDERLKDSIPYEGGLEEILGIVPIRYRWNDKGQKHTGFSRTRDYVGFSANNVQRAIPEAIQGLEGPEQYLSFDDRPVIAALVNAIKELKAEIEALKRRQ